MISNRQKPPAPWPMVVLFFVITICVIVVGVLYYYNQKKTLLQEKQQELSAISDLKIRQITQWRLDRLGNARFLGENTLMLKRISEFFQKKSNKSLHDNVLQSLKSLTENFDYKNVLLIDTTGNVRLSYPDQDTLTLIGDHLKPLLPGVINKRKVVLTDLHRASLVSFVHLDLIIPLIDQSTNDTLVLGLLALRIDPQKVLYPLIQSWPTPGKSAESLIIRREGDDIVYLNELRHINNGELLFRKPLSTDKLAAAMAIQGISSTVDALDYRGVQVVASMKKIRARESLSQLQEQLKSINDNESATFETFHKRKDGSVFPIEISSRLVNIEGVKYYQTIGRDITERRRADDTLKESEEKFRKIFEESPFSMVMTGKDLGIVRANQSFCNMIGYDEEELKSFTFRNFTHPDYISDSEVSLMKLVAQEIPTYHTEKKYIRKNGSIIWGSTTVSIIRNNKGEVHFFLVMVEDITSRKETATALENSFSLVKATLESTADGLLVVDSVGKIVQFNQKFADMWKIPQKILSTGKDSEALGFVKDQLISPDRWIF